MNSGTRQAPMEVASLDGSGLPPNDFSFGLNLTRFSSEARIAIRTLRAAKATFCREEIVHKFFKMNFTQVDKFPATDRGSGMSISLAH